MKTIFNYSFSSMRQNKKGNVFMLIAIAIATALLYVLCSYVYTGWASQVRYMEENRGTYHAAINHPISAADIPYITENPDVAEVYLQKTTRFLDMSGQGTERPYFLYMEFTPNSWEGLALSAKLTSGRAPAAPGEIVVSDLFFKDNPQFKMGDSLSAPVGQRLVDGKALAPSTPTQPGEIFEGTGTVDATIVGTISVQVFSAFPAYHAYGCFNARDLPAEETVYPNMRYANLRDTYTLTPEIAKAVGLVPQEDGTLPLVYNTALLEMYGVKSPNESGSLFTGDYFAIGVVGGALVMAMFIVIIYNAFSVAAAGQLRQLGILKSVGASPVQVRWAVLLQGLLLAVVGIPLGLLLGVVTSSVVMNAVRQVLSTMTEQDVMLRPPFWLFSIVILAALLTVLLSAWMPARRLAKLSAIEAVRGTEGKQRIKKAKNHRIARRLFGFEGELAAGQLAANRRPYRTAVISLTLCLSLMAAAMCLTNGIEANRMANLKRDIYNLDITIDVVEEPDADMVAQLRSLPGAEKSILYRSAETSLLLDESQMDDGYLAKGGLDTYDSMDSYLEKGQYRLYTSLLGLAPEDFDAYCREIGADPAAFDNGKNTAVVVNEAMGSVETLIWQNKLTSGPLIKAVPGESFTGYDRLYLEQEGHSASFSFTVGAVTSTYPAVQKSAFPNTLTLVVPMQTYERLTTDFDPADTLRYRRVYLKTQLPEESLATVQVEAEAIMGQQLPDEDYKTWSHLDSIRESREGTRMMYLLITAAALFLGLVGVSSAFSSIGNSLAARRRPFAMLRSAGLAPKGLARMLRLEALMFSLIPLVLSLPVILLLVAAISMATPYIGIGTLFAVAPWPLIVGGMAFILLSILAAYALSGRRIKQDAIVEAIKDETF